MAQATDTENNLDSDIVLIQMLAKIGYELYAAHLVGNSCPRNTKRWKRMEKPLPGDLVIEVSTSGWWRKGDRPHPGPYEYLIAENATGVLDKITQEPYPGEEDEPPWNETEEGGPEPLETVYYIKRLHTDDPFRWTNARFVTILPVEGWAAWEEQNS